MNKKNPDDIDLGPLTKAWRLNGHANLAMHLAVVGRLVDRCVARRLADHGLNLAQWRSIALLEILGSSTFGTLAGLAWLDRGDLSRALSTLEERGLIVRAPNPQDKRSPVFSLTDVGHASYASFAVDWRGFEKDYHAVFDISELALFNQGLERVARKCLEMLGEV